MRRKHDDAAPPLLGFTLMVERIAQGLTQEDLAREAGTSAPVISGLETRPGKLKHEKLAAYSQVMGIDAEELDFALFALGWILAGRRRAGTDGADEAAEPDAAERRAIRRAVARVLRSAGEMTRLELGRNLREERQRRERAAAAELGRYLRGVPAPIRRVLVERAREYQTVAMCEWLCAESERAAAADAGKAIEWAELAVRVAQRVRGDEGRRQRAEGYARAHLANARRVANDHAGAASSFAEARKLWEAGATGDDGFLDPTRPLDLEASLLRDQRRFDEALKLHDSALAVATPRSAVYILLNKSATFEQAGRYAEAVSALTEATPRVDAQREPRLICVLQFNRAANLCNLGRYADADALLPEIRAMAIDLRLELDLVRVLWLDGRIAAGLGRIEQAIAALEQVRREFMAKGLPYDLALAALDLAVLYLNEGRTAEVKELAQQMVAIFEARHIEREALAAVVLFQRAAEAETATAALATKISRYLALARLDPDFQFEEEARNTGAQ